MKTVPRLTLIPGDVRLIAANFARRLPLVLAALTLTAVWSASALAQVSITATAGTAGPTPYTTLNSSGAGSASYTSVLVQPTADAVSVSGNPVTGFVVIQLNGADNVTLNGDNPNTGGTNRNLTINNTTTATVIANSAIRIATSTAVTSADNNTIKNCSTARPSRAVPISRFTRSMAGALIRSSIVSRMQVRTG